MKLSIQNQDYFVSFPEVTDKIHAEQEPKVRNIACNIRKWGEKDIVVSKISKPYKKDNLVKTIAEKNAFAKCMKVLEWDKTTRTEAWKQYFASSVNRTKLVRKNQVLTPQEA